MIGTDDRSLVTSMLTPPPGYKFESGLATSYSLDPGFLLQAPLYLALRSGGREILQDPVLLLEAIERSSESLVVFADRGQMHPPSGNPSPLFGLLENLIVEVEAPGEGAFHPKLWLLRFESQVDGESAMLRLAILSRNLTFDRSWDLSLVLDGKIGRRFVAENRELGEFINDLPRFATGSVEPNRKLLVRGLASDLRHTKFELPAGYDSVTFHVLGTKKRNWLPAESDETVVISPFLKDKALKSLAKITTTPLAIISRPEELSALSSEVRDSYDKKFILDTAAETEDGEESTIFDVLGLHAKIIACKHGWNTRLYIGSANCTNAALNGKNVEVMAELTGRVSKVGAPHDLYGENGLGSVLTEYEHPDDPPEVDTEAKAAQAAVDAVRTQLLESDLRIICERADTEWLLKLASSKPITFQDEVEIQVWPITVSSTRKVSAQGLKHSNEISLAKTSTANVTGITAFEVSYQSATSRFALNLEVTGLPEDRHGAIISSILRDQDGFLRYLFLILGEIDLLAGGASAENHGQFDHWNMKASGVDGMPLLEEMVRVLCREPDRLREIDRVVEDLSETEVDGIPVIPPAFLEVWKVFESAIGKPS